VIWFDRRLDPRNVRINTWQAVSSNDAASFASSKISSSDWNPNLGSSPAARFIGDYNGLAASTDAVYACGPTGATMPIGRPASARRNHRQRPPRVSPCRPS
jgi:hypothetical protein